MTTCGPTGSMRLGKPAGTLSAQPMRRLSVIAAALLAVVGSARAGPAERLLDAEWSQNRPAVLAQARVVGHAMPVYVIDESTLTAHVRVAEPLTPGEAEFRAATLEALTAPAHEQYSRSVRSIFIQLPEALGGDATCLIVTGGKLGHEGVSRVRDIRVRYQMGADEQLLHEAAHCRGHWLMTQSGGQAMRDLIRRFGEDLEQAYPGPGLDLLRASWLKRYRTNLHEAYADMLMSIVCCGPGQASRAARSVASFRTWLYLLNNDQSHFTAQPVEALAIRVDHLQARASQGGEARWVDDEFVRDQLVTETLSVALPATLLAWRNMLEHSAIHLAEFRQGAPSPVRQYLQPDAVQRAWIDAQLSRAASLGEELLVTYSPGSR